MRPPRIAIVVFFLASSFFLVGRAIGAATSRSAHRIPSHATKSSSGSASGGGGSRAGVWGLIYYNTPFSLFPPNAAISLTDDNSTSFAARPAAFGPQINPRGLSGQLWVGSGFADEALDGDGELGCSDLPGWDGGGSRISLKSSGGGGAGIIPHAGLSAATRKTGSGGSGSSSSSSSSHNNKRDGDAAPKSKGTDNHLHQASGAAAAHADIQSMQEAAEIQGKVVLLMRGGCGFLEKVMWAQRRGATAVIVGDNQKGGPLIQMFAHGDAVDNVTIPSVFTARTTAQILSSLTQPGSFIEDALDDNGRPVLKVQQSPKSRASGSSSSNSRARRGQATTTDQSRKQKKASSLRDADTTAQNRSWLSRLLGGWGEPSRNLDENSRPPSSGRLDWVLVDEWDEEKDKAIQASMGSSRTSGTRKTTPTVDDNFVIGVHDWRDPDLLDKHNTNQRSSSLRKNVDPRGTPLPYTRRTRRQDEDEAAAALAAAVATAVAASADDKDIDDGSPVWPPAPGDDPGQRPHEGLWVTITPTSSASPFLDTLLVLVVSPLVTLTVVYALLIVRARIRRRQWRAPKSVIDQLPVRTFHAHAATPTPTPPRQPSPSSMSPTTPLLHNRSRTPSPPTFSRPRSRTTTGIPESSASNAAANTLAPESGRRHRSNNHGFPTEWRRYMGRQVECVVCLEEYVDGVSRVMRLPCGHEFHADCITPWLTTRRRTCPICKGDVVRSLAHASSSGLYYGAYHDDSDDDVVDDEEPAEHGGRPVDVEQGHGEGPSGRQQRSGRQDRPWMSLWPSHFGSQPQGDGH